VVATGHFSYPNVPHFEGIETFSGQVLHAHDFRGADPYVGKNLLLIGSSYSAEDIGVQCYKHVARSVTISYRSEPMGFNCHEGRREIHDKTHIRGEKGYFKDGNSGSFDAVILCTVYKH